MYEQFTTYLVSIRGYSQGTANGYVKDIKQFATWAKANLANARWSNIERADIDRYISELVSQGLKPATTNRKLASISALYNWFIRDGRLTANPCKFESRRKREQTIPNTIPTDQLCEAYEHATGVTRLIIGLIATTGMRIQEVLDLTWEDIDFKTFAIKVHGKGLKQRIVYTTSAAVTDLLNILQYQQPTGPMFRLEQREVRHMIWQALKPYCTCCQLSPHAIRHTFATSAATAGANCSTLAQILGHKHLNTTQKYIDMTQAPVKEVCQQYNPLKA